MKGARRKCFFTIVLVVIMLFSCLSPFSYVASATTGVEITLNSELYNAVKTSLTNQGINATFSDVTRTITITETDLANVTYLDLSNSSIDDLTGLSAFSSVSNINLTANELTADSNLSELDSLPLTNLNLSSNKLESVSSITSFDSINQTDITNQEVETKEIVIVDITEESDHSKTYTVSLPDILLKDTGSVDADWIDAELDGDATVNWATVNGTSLEINVASGNGDDYAALKGLIKIMIDVKDSSSKLANTKMTLNYVVIDSDETGIIFEDEYLYNAVKSQLTAKQTENEELESHGEGGTTLYLRNYDDSLILVIDTNTLINRIPSLVLNDKRISDLTGLEEFVGLDTELNLSYNYIDTIERIIELDENKEAKELELQERYGKYLTNLSSYRTSLKSALEEYDSQLENYEKLQTSDNVSDTELANAAQELASVATSISTYRSLISATLEKLYDIYENEYLLTTILTADTITLTSDDIYDSNLETIRAYAEAIMDKVSSLEEEEALSDWEAELIINEFSIPTQTEIEGEQQDIENPITSYFNTLKEGADLQTISSYQNFVYQMKIIDAAIVAGNYCLNERLYGEEDSCIISSQGFDQLIADLDMIGFDSSFATEAKGEYSSGCMCDMIDVDSLSTSAIEEIISGKYANAQELISTFVKLPRLKNLNMTDNSVESIDGIEALAELENLNMYKNLLGDVTGIDWSTFTNMTDLNLGYNQLSDVNCLEVLKNLQNLNLTKNLISGSFSFSMVGMEDLESADFSYNQISDIAYFTNQFKFLAKAQGMEVEEYVLSEYCPKVKFQYQTLSLEMTVVQDGSFITVDLPAIFEQAEKIDYSRTSFGIDSLLGTVEADGTTAKLYTPSLGQRTAMVTIEGNNGNSYSTDGLAYGTTCNIVYTVVEEGTEPEDPTDPVDPEDPTDPGTEDPTDPEDPDTPETPDITYGYTVEDGYVYVNTPEITVSTFSENLVEDEGYTLNIVNSDSAIGNYIATGAVVSINGADGESVELLEVVVLGDVNGDGEVDALDSGIVKNVRIDVTSLVGSYAEAADVNNDGDIDSLDSQLILRYRADIISSF